MSITTPNRGAFQDVGLLLTEIERRLIDDQAPPVPVPPSLPDGPEATAAIEAVTDQAGQGHEPVDQLDEREESEPAVDDVDQDDEFADAELVPAGPGPVASGETRRVQKLRRQVAESHRLAALQSDDTPLLVDTSKVRKRRLAVLEAARLHELTQDPVALAYRDAKVRRSITVMALMAAGIGLAASSIGVQASVAKALKLDEHTLGWWAAFGVEPALSLPLLATIGAQAYSAMRGKVVDRKSAEGRKLFFAEALLFALTLVLNCWPALVIGFDPLTLLVHSLGPVAAVIAVWVMPTLWHLLSVLPVPEILAGTGRTEGRTALQYRANANRQYGSPPQRARVDIEVLTDRARTLIDAGKLSADAGVHKYREALGCGSDPASKVKKALKAAAPAIEGATQ